MGMGIKPLAQQLIAPSAEELELRREPIHMMTQAIQEMQAPDHVNNIYQNYAFDVAS
jgi:hypothetical protein